VGAANDGAIDFAALIARARVGTSTGYMTTLRGNWPRLVAAAEQLSTEAVELSALSVRELPGLLAFLTDARFAPSFDYVSVHAPTKGLEHGTSEVVELLDRLPGYVRTVVFHPDTVDDAPRLGRLGGLVVFENMDTRKLIGQTPETLAPYFAALPRAGFCLDLAHVSAIDPKLDLAHAFLDAFGERLRQVHLSSLNDRGAHVPLTSTDAHRFAPLLSRTLHVPWILEAPVEEDLRHASQAAA
jgi:hypothetical protein